MASTTPSSSAQMAATHRRMRAATFAKMGGSWGLNCNAVPAAGAALSTGHIEIFNLGMGGMVAVVVVNEVLVGGFVMGSNNAVMVEVCAVVRTIGSTSIDGPGGSGTLNSGC
uniref:Uncharacterized protein n=1 Tax=Romanomermis culicivorax TaxID=13658 RepID=A0A915L4K8_ROMCU